ncbi:thioredoxin [Isoptericola jiangsuensis]|uniref:Thioredoxin n=1 Tax=Isoptericola jiangsuensis TaxID=548579 RepID=A0A2A9F1N7_9MICO|nr:thiol reductase thioredoxin [Isoptericola jiangsuensis]PFG44452.1 thioredoxin [Isoptericola jiangsuensis]
MPAQWTTLAVVVVVTVLVGLVWRRAQGRVRTTAAPAGDEAAGTWRDEVATAGATLGERATFLQLSAQVCSSCRATARTLTAVRDAEPGVVHVEVDVDERPDLVRRARMLRTPTVLVLDATGTEVARASGTMSPVQAREALAAVDATARSPRRIP